MDCIEEDESYLKQTNLYSTCTTSSSSNYNNNNKCFDDRAQPLDPNNALAPDDPFSTFYPGYDTNKCPKKGYKPHQNHPKSNQQIKDKEFVLEQPGPVVKRSYNEAKESLFVKEVSNCRILRSSKGDLRRRCDRIVETRALDYETSITLFPSGADITTGEKNLIL